MMSTLRQNKPITIVLFGRTGVGKSSLANKMIGRECFVEGHSLSSQTDAVASETFTWPLDPSIQVKIVDTPGFADNRPEMTNGELLSRILDFLKSLEDGLHIAVFCLSANTRIDQHDTQELHMLSLLLGRDLFEHVCIAITQGNLLVPDERQRMCENYVQELPLIFMRNGLPPFTQEKMLFADFDRFQERFLEPMTELIRTTTSYVPKLAEEIDPQDPKSIERFLATPEMKELMAVYEEKAEETKRKMEEMEKAMQNQTEEHNKRIASSEQQLKLSQEKISLVDQELKVQQAQIEKERKDHEEYQKQEKKKMNDLTGQIDSLTSKNHDSQRQLQLLYQEKINMSQQNFEAQQAENEKKKRYYEDYRKQEEKKFGALTEKIDSLNSQNNSSQKQLDRYQSQIKLLNKKLKQFKEVKAPQPQIIYRDRQSGGGFSCNIF